MIRAGVFLEILALALVLAARLPAQDETAELAEAADEAEPAGGEGEDGGATESSEGGLGLLSDPTLGGRLHTTYRLGYVGRIYDFGRYETAVRVDNPGSRAIDEEQAKLLERRHRDTSDQDLDQYLAFRLDQLPVLEGSRGLVSSVGGSAALRYFKDLDGSPAGEESHGGFDRLDGRQALQLQTLNVRLEAISRHLDLVLGRQYGREAEWLHFDGGTATFRGLQVLGREVEVSAFGGERVYFFSRSTSPWGGLRPRGGEEVFGGHLKAKVLDHTLLRVSDVHYADNSLEVELRQELGNLDWLSLLYRMVNEDPHSVALNLAKEWRSAGLSLYFSYVGKLGRNADDFNFDYTQSSRRRSHAVRDLYFDIGDIQPYDEATLEARKALSDLWGVSLGGTVHRLRERDRNDNYNTDWQEIWAGLDAEDLGWKGLSARATVRYIHTTLPRRRIRLNVEEAIENGVPDFRESDVRGNGEPGSLGVEVLVEKDFERLLAVGGTAVFRAYDYRNNFVELQSLTAASLGAHARWRVTSWAQVLLGYSFDSDYRFVSPDLDALHTVRLQTVLRW